VLRTALSLLHDITILSPLLIPINLNNTALLDFSYTQHFKTPTPTPSFYTNPNPTKPKMASNNQPSMVAGHAQYAKGYVEETIGNVTGSKEWQESGKKDTQAGIGEMKVYSSFTFPSSSFWLRI
jgi:uncharacterized protein YjbJ (UPF0337 family)